MQPLSEPCRAEVQAAVQQLQEQQGGAPGGEAGAEGGAGGAEGAGPRRPKKSTEPVAWGIVLQVLGFVTAALAGVGGYVYYLHLQREQFLKVSKECSGQTGGKNRGIARAPAVVGGCWWPSHALCLHTQPPTANTTAGPPRGGAPPQGCRGAPRQEGVQARRVRGRGGRRVSKRRPRAHTSPPSASQRVPLPHLPSA